MSYHNLKGKLEPLNAETQKAVKWDHFADHMKGILGVLMVGHAVQSRFFTHVEQDKKTLCRHLATDYWTAAFIDAPELHALVSIPLTASYRE